MLELLTGQAREYLLRCFLQIGGFVIDARQFGNVLRGLGVGLRVQVDLEYVKSDAFILDEKPKSADAIGAPRKAGSLVALRHTDKCAFAHVGKAERIEPDEGLFDLFRRERLGRRRFLVRPDDTREGQGENA